MFAWTVEKLWEWNTKTLSNYPPDLRVIWRTLILAVTWVTHTHSHTHTQTERNPERVSQEEVMAGRVTQKGATGHTSLCRPLPPVSAPTHERQGGRMRKLCLKGLWDAQGQIMTGFPWKCALTGQIRKGILDWTEPTLLRVNGKSERVHYG